MNIDLLEFPNRLLDSYKYHVISMIIARRPQTSFRVSQQIRSRRWLIRQHVRVQRRCASTASTPGCGSPAANTHVSQIAVITNELDKLSPRFDVPAESIEILQSPTEFYEALKACSNRILFGCCCLGWYAYCYIEADQNRERPTSHIPGDSIHRKGRT